jgi:hypothetical protein
MVNKKSRRSSAYLNPVVMISFSYGFVSSKMTTGIRLVDDGSPVHVCVAIT